MLNSFLETINRLGNTLQFPQTKAGNDPFFRVGPTSCSTAPKCNPVACGKLAVTVADAADDLRCCCCSCSCSLAVIFCINEYVIYFIMVQIAN